MKKIIKYKDISQRFDEKVEPMFFQFLYFGKILAFIGIIFLLISIFAKSKIINLIISFLIIFIGVVIVFLLNYLKKNLEKNVTPQSQKNVVLDVTECSECGRVLDMISIKHKLNNNMVACNRCFKKLKDPNYLKNKQIITNYILKYIKNKNMMLDGHILEFSNSLLGPDKNAKIDENILEQEKENFQSMLNEAETSNKTGLSSYEIDDIIETKEMSEKILDFIDDLEKMYKLFKKKNIETDYFEIVSIFEEIIQRNIDNEYDKVLIPSYKRISKKLGDNVSKEKVIEEFMKIPIEIDYNYDIISRLLNKFNFSYNFKEVKEIIEKIKEEMDLEDFEQTLGSSKNIFIGDFTKLKGYEFEDYLKNLFKLLGYTVIKTSLSGDQGADLIVSKDNEKIVVQAKKYDGKVSNKAVQEIVAAKNHYKADKAIVVTNSSFTKSAIDLALSNNVELWDGIKLKNIIKNLKGKTEEKILASEKAFSFKDSKNIQSIKVPCPFCEEEFDYKYNREKGFEAKINCPNCGASITMDIKSRTWRCEYCNKKFNTKDKAEEHEKSCKKK